MRSRSVGTVVAVIALAVAGQSSRTDAQAAARKGGKGKAPAKAAKAPAAPARFLFEVAPAGNEARYRVREQLVGVDLPNDAVGATPEVSGSLLVYADGRV